MKDKITFTEGQYQGHSVKGNRVEHERQCRKGLHHQVDTMLDEHFATMESKFNLHNHTVATLCIESEAQPDAEPETPKHVWECCYEYANCGWWPIGGMGDRRVPSNWHTDCWDKYQIKTLREMIGVLMCALDCANKFWRGLPRAAREDWTEVVNQLAELYPAERKDTP